jgi:hypothetical protein
MEATLGELVDAIIAVDGWEPTDGNRAGLGALCRFTWGLDVVPDGEIPDGATLPGVGRVVLAVWEYADEVEAAQAFHDFLELPPYGPVRALGRGGKATGPELVAAFNGTRFGWCPPELAAASIDFAVAVPTEDPFPEEEEIPEDAPTVSLGELEAIAEAAKAVGAATLAGVAAALHELAYRLEALVPGDVDQADVDEEEPAQATKRTAKTPKS